MKDTIPGYYQSNQSSFHMIVDGMECYTSIEAAEKSGYSLGTVRTYVSSGEIDSIKLKESGAVFVTEKGLLQLLNKKGRKTDHLHHESDPISDKPVLEEKIDSEAGMPYIARRSFNLYTVSEVRKYDKLKELAVAMRIPLNSLLNNIISDYVDASEKLLDLIKRQEEERKKVMQSIWKR